MHQYVLLTLQRNDAPGGTQTEPRSRVAVHCSSSSMFVKVAHCLQPLVRATPSPELPAPRWRGPRTTYSCLPSQYRSQHLRGRQRLLCLRRQPW
jgi:hypothetical protein